MSLIAAVAAILLPIETKGREMKVIMRIVLITQENFDTVDGKNLLPKITFSFKSTPLSEGSHIPEEQVLYHWNGLPEEK